MLPGNWGKEKFIKSVSKMEEKKKKNLQYCCDREISPGNGWTGRREK